MIDKNKIEKLIYDLLLALGEDPEREGLRDTPRRVSGMLEEFFTPEKPIEELVKTFKEDFKNAGIVEVGSIPFCSLCEHHMLPFMGVASIKYRPDGNFVIGLSKLARIVKHFSKGLNVQERITENIAEFIFSNFSVKGVEVTLEAEHLCMSLRGVKALGSKTKTVSFRGNLN